MGVSVRRALVWGALGCATLTAGQDAAAQYYGPPAYPYNAPPPYPGPPPIGNRFYGYARPIPPDDIVDRLEDQGYRDVAPPRFAGSTYVTVATRGRERVRIVVDAFRGVVVGQSPVARRDARRFEDDDAPPPAYRPRRPETLGYGYGGAPPAPAPIEAPRPRAVAPPPAEARAPAETRPPAEARLPAPADARLAPGAAPSGAGTAVLGTNPDAGARPNAKPARPAAREARKPNQAAVPGERPPVAFAPPAAEAQPRPDRPVRVIQGVTPLNNGAQAEVPPQTSAGAPAPATE